MVMADDDEDSDNDCLYIDESVTEPENQGSTSQNPSAQNVPRNKTRNALPQNSAEVPLIEKVNVEKNIPNDITNIPNDQAPEVTQKARITCKPFSRKPFDAKEPTPFLKSVDEMKEGSDMNAKIKQSALYYFLTADKAVPPEHQYTSIPHEGDQNPFTLELKQLLVAPSRPPTMPYPPIATVTPYQRSGLQSNPLDPRTPPLTDVQNEKQPPHIQANQTSVTVHPGVKGTTTLKPTSDQQANNVPTKMRINGYPIQNGQRSQFNSDANIRQMYSQNTEIRTELIGQTSMTNLGEMPYRNCELNCPCRNGGPIPTSPSNPETTGRGRGLKTKPLVNSQRQQTKCGRGRPKKTAANPHPTGRKVSVDIPYLNTHQPNLALNPYINGMSEKTVDIPPLNNQVINPDVNPDRGLTVGPLDMPSLSPQPIIPNLNDRTEVPMDTSLLNPNLNGKTGGPMDTSLLNPNLNGRTEGPMGTPYLNPNLNGKKGGPMDTTHLNRNLNGKTGGPMDTSLLNPNLNGRTGGPMDTSLLNPNLNGNTRGPMDTPHLTPNHNDKTGGPMGMPHLKPNHNDRKEGQMDIPRQQINHALNLYVNGTAGGPIDVPHLNPNFNSRTGRPMDMPHFNPNLNGTTEGVMPHVRIEGPMNMPHLHPYPSMNSISNLDFHGRTGGPMDMPQFNPNLNGMTEGAMPHGRIEGPMNMPHLHPHPSMNPISNLDLHGRTGEPMDMPQFNPNLNGMTEGAMPHGRIEGPMNMPHLHPHPSMNPISNLDLHGRTGEPMDMPHFNPNLNGTTEGAMPHGRIERPMNMPHLHPRPSMNPTSPQSHQHLNPHLPNNPEQPMDMHNFNPNLNGREEYLDMQHLNLVHESMNSSNPQHQPIHPLILQQHANHMLLQQHQSMNVSMSHHQPMNPSLRMREEREDPIVLPFNAQHQTLNHHNSRMPPCYQCATGMPCENRLLASTHTIPQTGVPMMNPQTAPRNCNKQAYNRKDSMPHHPGYSDEEIQKANYLACLRSQPVLETASRDIFSPSVANTNAPRLNTTANLRAARFLNSDAGLAGSPTCNDPTSNGVYTPAQPYVSPPKTYPIPNWEALGTHHTVTKKQAAKTVTKTTKANILAAKKAQEISLSISTGQILPLTMNAEIPHIDLTVDLTQNANTNTTPNIMPVLLNTEAQKETVNIRIDTTQTNVTTKSHNINKINLMQVPLGEDQLRQILMKVNNNGELTHLMETSAAPHETLTEDINKEQINTEQPWISIKSDGNKIPLLMDEEDMSIKNNVETTIQPSVIKVTETIAQSVQNEAFVQQIRNDMDVEDTVAQLHANTDENIPNTKQTSKTPVQSTKAYEVVSTTSVTSESMSQNIKSNDIPKPGTFNSGANTTLTVSRKQIIENTVTVSLVKQIVTNPNISLPETDTLVDILNKVKPSSMKPCSSINHTENLKMVTFKNNIHTKEDKAQTREGMELSELALKEKQTNANISLLHILSKVKQIPTKICSNIDQTDSTIGNFNDNICPKKEKEQTGAMELSRIRDKYKNIFNNNNLPVGDGNKKGINHEQKELCDSNDDDKLITARQNLARLRVTENERATVNTKADSDNKYQIEIRTCVNNNCIAQVKIPSFNSSCAEPEEFHINCITGNAAQIVNVVNNENNQGGSSNEIGLGINVVNNENYQGGTSNEISQGINKVDEPHENTNNENSGVSGSSIDEIIFFKFQINFFRLVQERLSENNHEEFAIKLHNDIIDLRTLSEDDDAKADMEYECHECHNVTLYSPRQLYYHGSKILKVNNAKNCQLCITFRSKYIEVLIKYITLETSLGTLNNQITKNTENNNRMDNTVTEFNNEQQAHFAATLHNDGDDSPIKNKKNEQQGLITDEVPSCSKQAKTDDQENHHKKNTPDSQKQTNSIVVKLSRNLLKESTIKKLIHAKFNNNESGDNCNVPLQDKNYRGNNDLSNPGEGTSNISITLTKIKENHPTNTKCNNAEPSYSKNQESQNNLSTNSPGSYRNKERHFNNTASSSNPLTNGDTITSSNGVNTNDPNEDSQSKKKKYMCDKPAFSSNPETQNLNKTNVSANRDYNMNQERLFKKRKSINTETAPTANADSNNRNTSTTTNISDDQVKSHENHSKKRKIISAGSETVTSPDAEKQNSNNSPKNSKDNYKNQETNSKKRKSSSAETAPIEIPEFHVNNASDNKNENNCERHAKKRKSINIGIPITADTHNCHDNYKNKQKDLGAKTSRCAKIITTEDKGNGDKDAPSKNNKVRKTQQPSITKQNEITTSKNADSLKKNTITISNNNNSNTNKKQLCKSDKNKETDNNEIRKSINTETTPNKTTQQLNVQDNTSNKEKENDTNVAGPESRKSTSAYILNKSQTTPSSIATNTNQTKNNACQNQNKETAEQNDVCKNNDGEKQNNDERKDNEKPENTAKNHSKDKIKNVDVCKNNNKQNHNTRKDDENDEEEDDDENYTKVLQRAMENCFKNLNACGDSNKNVILGNLFKTLSEKLYSKESDDLPEVKITGKQEKKSEKCKGKISYKYLCYHCSVSYRSLDACRSHVKNGHKKAKIVAKDCIEVRKCEYCTRYIQEKLYNKHIRTHHKDIHLQIINDEIDE